MASNNDFKVILEAMIDNSSLSNIQKQLDNLGKSMTMYGVFNTKADLIASTTPTPVDGNTAIVIADEDNNNKQMTYIYIASNAAWTQVAENSIKVRNFSTDPINLATETSGTLQKEKNRRCYC